MPEEVYLAFDFGFKRIGIAVGQRLTLTATPLTTLNAKAGQPNWLELERILKTWGPQALVVGLPTCLDDQALYTTSAARNFAEQLKTHFSLPVYLTDERLTTKEARAQLYSKGGFRKLKRSEIDSVAACLILEQWLQYPD